MNSFPVETSSKLRVSYSLHLVPDSEETHVVILHHGILHTRETFDDLIKALNARGIHAVMIEQQSEDAGFWRNCIGLEAYLRGMKDATLAVWKKLAEQEPPLEIGIYAVHSMGAEIWQETQQAYPLLRRPTVLMAPIPLGGALRTSLRIAWDHPLSFLKAVVTMSVHSLAKKPDRVRELFFDDDADMDVVRRTAAQLTHSPFWSYLQLTFRRQLRPEIEPMDMPQQLLFSDTDYIFHPEEFDTTRERYGKLLDERKMNGGHDFFIGDADPTAAAIEEFFQRTKMTRVDDQEKLKGPQVPELQRSKRK